MSGQTRVRCRGSPSGWETAAGTSLTAGALSPAAGNGMFIAGSAEPVAGGETSRPFTGDIRAWAWTGDFRTRVSYRMKIR